MYKSTRRSSSSGEAYTIADEVNIEMRSYRDSFAPLGGSTQLVALLTWSIQILLKRTTTKDYGAVVQADCLTSTLSVLWRHMIMRSFSWYSLLQSSFSNWYVHYIRSPQNIAIHH